MVNTKHSKVEDSFGNEYNVTFIYGNLPSSTVAKELASLYNMDKKYSIIPKEVDVEGHDKKG